MRIIGAFAVAIFALAGSAFAQAPSGSENTITVTAPARNAQQSFAHELSIPPFGHDQLARWSEGICPGVIGAPRDQAQFLIDRIAVHARAAGLGVDEPGCSPDILVIVTSDAPTLARQLGEQYRGVLGYYSVNGDHTRGRAAFQNFIDTDRPVRWWHVSRTGSADGRRHDPNPIFQRTGPSRLNRMTKENLDRAFIIIDTQRAAHIPLSALADYVSMVALAQIDPNAATTRFDTILNLFNTPPGQTPPAQMTAWDIAYVNGLYSSAANTSAAMQTSMIGAAVQHHGGDH